MKDLKIIDDFLIELVTQLNKKINPFPMLGILTNNQMLLPIPVDSKVISKLFETLAESCAEQVIKKHPQVKIISNAIQNQYPDFYVSAGKTTVAVDIKSSYKKSPKEINGMTLGSYMGYFRGQAEVGEIAYEEFIRHYCLCFFYERSESKPFKSVRADKPHLIESPIKNVEVMFREKWQIASRTSGSGNTKNIGSIKNIEDLKSKPLFTDEQDFRKFWTTK